MLKTVIPSHFKLIHLKHESSKAKNAKYPSSEISKVSILQSKEILSFICEKSPLKSIHVLSTATPTPAVEYRVSHFGFLHSKSWKNQSGIFSKKVTLNQPRNII